MAIIFGLFLTYFWSFFYTHIFGLLLLAIYNNFLAIFDNLHLVTLFKGINMKIFPNEITAILGHNGAGKTTLFNMLTGMTSATSGTANICGYTIPNTYMYFGCTKVH